MSERSPRQSAFWMGVAAVLAIAWCAPFQARADTWYVNGSVEESGDGTSWAEAFQTIGEGIDAASYFTADEVIVADGTYIGGTWPNDDRNRELEVFGKPVIITSANGPANCIIDCEGTDVDPHWAFWIDTDSGETTRLEGFTIRRAYLYYAGAGIFNEGSGSFRISDCVFEDNYADSAYGGAICNNYTNGAIIKCTFTGNYAEKGGAVASAGGQVDIVNCTFVGNTAETWAGAVDAVDGHSSTLTNCRFAGNLAIWAGGAISCGYSADLTLKNCTISGNRAIDHAGAINADDTGTTVTLDNCILWDDEV